MTKPRFANTKKHIGIKKTQEIEKVEINVIEREESAPSSAIPTISEFMAEQMRMKEKQATRPITLRFEDALWQRVETLRGGMSKNDFFKELVAYYDQSKR